MHAIEMVEEIYGDKVCDTKEHEGVLTKAAYVYGDTDSVSFTFNFRDIVTKELIRGKKTSGWTIELAQEVAETCNLWLKLPMGLEYEKTWTPFMLSSKKRHVGGLHEFNTNKDVLKYVGLSLKRRDSCDSLKDTYGEILNMLMKENGVEKSIEYLNHCLGDVVNGRVHIVKPAIPRAMRNDYKILSQIVHKVLTDRKVKNDGSNENT